MEELYGKKMGMTQIFIEDGKVVPATVIEVYNMTVVDKKTQEKDGYNAIVVSFGKIKESKINKPLKGLYLKVGLEVKKYLREIRLENIDDYEIGKEITLADFENIERVDVQGTSKGKGFQGPIKRHGLKTGPKTHGSNYHRRPGSMGAGTSPGRVFKGKKLAGHMGAVVRTTLNLDVIKLDIDKSAILIKGSVPGAIKSIVKIKKSVKQ